MTKTIYHKASTRGHADHGWLNSYHTFSFAGYHNPERVHFGMLRVLNDDTVQAGQGFCTHPHNDMEIVSIPLEGDLEHKDSMGNTAIIRHGDVQVMSAGTGIYHSENNHNNDRLVKFLQIWVFPNKKGVTPRYDQITLDINDRRNNYQQIVSPNPDDDGVWLHQDAWFHLAQFDRGFSLDYEIKKTGNGVYAFVLSGELEVNCTKLDTRDGFGMWDLDKFSVKALSQDAEILLIEVPMK